MNGFSLDIFKERNALLIFSSQLISSVCDKMMSIGLIWYLMKNVDPNVVPWFLCISFLPHLIFSFISPKLITKFKELNIILFSEFLRGFILVLFYFYLKNSSQENFLTVLYIAIFLVGIGSSIFTPAILSIPPKIVSDDKVMKLNALIDSSMAISSILGATFSVFILSWFDLKGLVLINAFSYFWALALQFFIVENQKSEVHSIDQAIDSKQLKIGTVLNKYQDIKWMLFCFLLLNLILSPIFVLIPWYVDKIYQGNSSDLSMIEGAMGLGAFLAGLYLSIKPSETDESGRGKIIAVVSLIFGFIFILFSLTTLSWHGAPLIFFLGASVSFLNVHVLTYFQTSLHESEVPVIMTAVNFIANAAVPVSLFVSGFIFPLVKIQSFTMVSGIVVLVTALFIPKIMDQRKISNGN